MDWDSVFDVVLRKPAGATEADIARFVAEVARSLTAVEIRKSNAARQNPFPKSDALHATWEPSDAAAWVMPDFPLPPSYLSLLRWSNGGEFGNGSRWFQFLTTYSKRAGVRAVMLWHQLPQYMPGALPVAFNGGGIIFLLDMREPAAGDEYPVVCAHAGNLGWDPGACRVVADSFEAACRGTVNVDDLLFSEH